ncbi:MAG: hypothetical protein WBG38_14260 [Nodosilinea sp.]
MSKVQPELSPAERKPLVEAGLIRLEKRGQPTHIVLEDKAWDWAVDNFDVELSLSKYAVPILQSLLTKVSHYLNAHQVSLAEVLTAPEEVNLSDEPILEDANVANNDNPSLDDVTKKVRQVYLSIPDGKAGFRVRLHQLREHLPGLSDQQTNQALLSMQEQGEISLLAAEDLQELNADDEFAAIDIGGGDKRYFAYMKR